MNERIRQKKPTKPVIVAQAPGGAQAEANRFNIYLGDGEILLGSVVFEPKGLAECETHEVKAWVELDPRVVSVRPVFAGVVVAPAVANAKNPNSPVSFLLKTKKP